MTTTFSEWEAGKLTDVQAARAIAFDLAELEEELTPALRDKETMRDQLSRIIAHAGGKMDISGFGSLQMTAPGVSTTYDAKRLDDLVLQLIAEGQSDIAECITACRKQSARAGSLRIVREKASK